MLSKFVVFISTVEIWNSKYSHDFNFIDILRKFEKMAFAECVFIISYDTSRGPQIRSVFPKGFENNLDQSLESLVFPKGTHATPSVEFNFYLLS